MTPPPTALMTLAWTPAEAALVLGPRADAELLALLSSKLLTEVEPGRYPAADLIAIHQALRPWLAGRQKQLATA